MLWLFIFQVRPLDTVLTALCVFAQLHPPSGHSGRAHPQHGVPPAAGLPQRALLPVAAHRQRLPAQDGGGAGP